MKRVAVLGAGISGLAFANRLREFSAAEKTPLEILILDKGSRPGGSIQTMRRDGFLLESGPDSFLSEKPWAVQLADRLGLSDQIQTTSLDHRRTFVAQGGKLHSLPEGFYLIAPQDIGSFLRTGLFSVKGKLRMMAEMLIPPDKTGADESVASFIRRRFGEESLERVGQPMIAGVYSGDPERLSILSTMPRFRELEARYGSVIRGLQRRGSPAAAQEARGPRYTLFLSFKGGMQCLTDRLTEVLGPASFRFGAETEELSTDPVTGQWKIRLKDAEPVFADAVCVATPAGEAARILRPVEARLADRLSQIRYESVATLNVAFRAEQVTHALDGFGFVVPRTEQRSLMACTFTHRKFAGRSPQGMVLLRAFVGGAVGRDIWDLNDADLERAVLADLDHYLGLRGEPVFSFLARYPQALPQYEVGHTILVRRIEREVSLLPNLVLTGSCYRGTGIPDCVRDAETQAGELWKSLMLSH